MALYTWPPIAANIDSTGLATSANQTLQITQETTTATKTTSMDSTLTTINGKMAALGQALMAASMPVTIASNQSAIPVTLSSTTITGTVAATQSGTWNITDISGTISLPTGAATESTLSTLNGKVTAVNTGAVTISTALPAGSAVIGKVSIDQTTPGTTNLVALAANQSVNVAQINGVTPLMGNGATGTGSQRVTIASDNTAFTVNNQVIPQSGSTNAASSAASTALASSLVIKASAGRLLQLTGVNTKASAQYIQVFNNTSAPADTTAPILLAYVPAGGNFSFDFGDIGRYFSTGITVTNSSTAATKTIGSADCWFNAEYL